MIPSKKSPLYENAKYSILELGDRMEEGDEYYNPFADKWYPLESTFIGESWNSDDTKPVRRKAGGN